MSDSADQSERPFRPLIALDRKQAKVALRVRPHGEVDLLTLEEVRYLIDGLENALRWYDEGQKRPG